MAVLDADPATVTAPANGGGGITLAGIHGPDGAIACLGGAPVTESGAFVCGNKANLPSRPGMCGDAVSCCGEARVGIRATRTWCSFRLLPSPSWAYTGGGGRPPVRGPLGIKPDPRTRSTF